MKKWVVVLAISLLVAFPAFPFVNGIIMERTVKRTIENINQMYADTGSDMRLDILEYNRGLFDTRVQWRVDFGSLAGIYMKEILLVEKADHGFLGISSETSLEKNIWYSDWVKTKLGGKDPLKIRTRYSATGPIASVVTLDAFSMETGKKSLNIGALEFNVSIDKAFEFFSTHGRWEGLFEETGKMGPLTFEIVHTKIPNLIWQGKGSMVMDEFTSDEQGASIGLSDISCSYNISADPDHQKMNMGMVMTAGGVEFDGNPLSKWVIDLGLKHVDIQAYEALVRLYYQVLNKSMAQTRSGLSTGEIGTIVRKTMKRNVPQFVSGLEKLLKKDFEIRMSKLNLELPQGKIKGRFSLGLKQDVTMVQCLMLAAQPDLALDIFFLQSDISLPLALVGDRQDLIFPMFQGMKTGLFVHGGDRLTHRAETRDNRLYLNGQEVVLEF